MCMGIYGSMYENFSADFQVMTASPDTIPDTQCGLKGTTWLLRKYTGWFQLKKNVKYRTAFEIQ